MTVENILFKVSDLVSVVLGLINCRHPEVVVITTINVDDGENVTYHYCRNCGALMLGAPEYRWELPHLINQLRNKLRD